MVEKQEMTEVPQDLRYALDKLLPKWATRETQAVQKKQAQTNQKIRTPTN